MTIELQRLGPSCGGLDLITSPPLRYHGGKWRLAPWIIRHFPPHAHYVEPFGGGGSVLLRKAPSQLETYNDADGEVVTFFRVLRERPEALARAIALTPWARAEYEATFDPLPPDCPDPDLERARRFYLRSWMSMGGGATARWRTGWRYHVRPQTPTTTERWRRLDHLFAVAERLRLVQIEQDDALEVIRRYDAPETLYYLDPPYVHSQRSKWRGAAYRHEMSDDDHRRLAELVHGLRGLVVISGYPSPLYQALYERYGWIRVETSARTNGTRTRTEALWLSPRAWAALSEAPLFDGEGK